MLNITTKTGDKGETGLADGQRILKSELRLEAIGSLDELNSWLGLVVVEIQESLSSSDRLNEKREVLAAEVDFILEIQNSLFSIGGELALAKSDRLDESVLAELEIHADDLNHKLSDDWPQQFILPGGSRIGAQLDLARSVCRRTERRMVELDHQSKLRPVILKTVNRLSDYLYLLRCFANSLEGITEIKFYSQSQK